MNLAIIIVAYNTRDLLRRCIQTVHASLANAAINYRIIVVDNASVDGTPAMVYGEFPEVHLIESGRNLGFAAGNNVALRLMLGVRGQGSGVRDQDICRTDSQSLTPDYVLLLNPDTEIVGDAIGELVRYLHAHDDVAVVGPQLRYPDGSVQSSRRRLPSRGVFFFESTPLENYFPHNPWAKHYRMEDRPDDLEQDADWLMGAALLVRRSVIERVGLLDEGFAMYSEELEWQQRIQGLEVGVQGSAFHNLILDPRPLTPTRRIVYLPNAVIIHHEGKSSEQALARRYVQFHQSRLRYVRMFYGPPHALGLWAFLLIVYGFELLVEASKWLLGHKRPLRAQRVAVYAEFLRRMQQGPLQYL